MPNFYRLFEAKNGAVCLRQVPKMLLKFLWLFTIVFGQSPVINSTITTTTAGPKGTYGIFECNCPNNEYTCDKFTGKCLWSPNFGNCQSVDDCPANFECDLRVNHCFVGDYIGATLTRTAKWLFWSATLFCVLSIVFICNLSAEKLKKRRARMNFKNNTESKIILVESG